MNMTIVDIEIVKTSSGKVVGRADIHFVGFELKGFKIIRDPEKMKEYVTPPSYLSPKGWRSLFKTDSEQDWEEIQRQVIIKFSQVQMQEAADESMELS
jgi:hypothetical protein